MGRVTSKRVAHTPLQSRWLHCAVILFLFYRSFNTLQAISKKLGSRNPPSVIHTGAGVFVRER